MEGQAFSADKDYKVIALRTVSVYDRSMVDETLRLHTLADFVENIKPGSLLYTDKQFWNQTKLDSITFGPDTCVVTPPEQLFHVFMTRFAYENGLPVFTNPPREDPPLTLIYRGCDRIEYSEKLYQLDKLKSGKILGSIFYTRPTCNVDYHIWKPEETMCSFDMKLSFIYGVHKIFINTTFYSTVSSVNPAVKSGEENFLSDPWAFKKLMPT